MQDGNEQNGGGLSQMIQRLPFEFSVFMAMNNDPTFMMDLNRLMISTIAKSKATKSLVLMSMLNTTMS